MSNIFKQILSIVFITFFIQNAASQKEIILGAERTSVYFPLLKDKKIAIVANQTSLVGETHLVDTLVQAGFDIKLVFSPEHGFRGTADAGEHVSDNVDKKTGLKLVSLYGGNKKPTPEQMQGVDLVIFDIQDLGVRFYTYISTMHYVMEACAENNVEFLVLDRPNPNGFYVDGPVLDLKYKSFVGMHPVPLVHGMTIAEFARMINSEGWLSNGEKCKLNYIVCENYTHKTHYELPVKPSPNIPDKYAAALYPSLGLFEGTVVSVGRGTDNPFKIFGHPEFKDAYKYSFVPKPMPGAKKPKLNGEECFGLNLGEVNFNDVLKEGFTLKYLIKTYSLYPDKEHFFNSFFYKLAGNKSLQQYISEGKTESEIEKLYQPGVEAFKKVRKKYLLYKDF